RDPRGGVGRARPGDGDADADVAAHAGIAIRHERAAALVAHQDVAQTVLVLPERVVEGAVQRPGNAEDDSHSLFDQAARNPNRTPHPSRATPVRRGRSLRPPFHYRERAAARLLTGLTEKS